MCWLEKNKEYVLSDQELDQILFERNNNGKLVLKRSGLSRISTTMAFARIKQLESQIRSTNDSSKKMNLLAKQNFYVGLLITIAANSKLSE